MTDIDKELMRRLKAETIGRLIALGMIFAGFMLFTDKKEGTTNASAPRDVTEDVPVQKAYADSVQNINAVKFDALKSRSK